MTERYPMVPAAFVIIFCSGTLKEALVAGILTIVLTVAAYLLHDLMCKAGVPEWSRIPSLLIGETALSYAAGRIAYNYVSGLAFGRDRMLIWLILGLLMACSFLWGKMHTDIDAVLYPMAMVYAIWMAAGLLREFLAYGEIFGRAFMEGGYLTKAFQSPIIGFLTAGAVLGIANAVTNEISEERGSLLSILPAAALAVPIQLFSDWQLVNWILGILLVGILVLSVRNRLSYSWTGKRMRGLPIELVSTGLIYMVLTVVK
ncbi:hypothetical protein [Diplocloster modestus]|uniref:Uncharacterized protein n=1 Tax=Diplocloster modestus TaxID=2850322 RepID=A0ABS6K8T1_9FIRM|nr:hypothetical protein [Diplocloster modestus]MBU9726923.1 hypothetical protein [Diplocloster modestus]